MSNSGRINDIQLVDGTCFNYKCASKDKCTRYKGSVNAKEDIFSARMVYIIDHCKLFKPKQKPTDVDETYGDLPLIGK